MFNWKNLSDMYNSQEYEYYISDKLGTDLFINDADRAERLADAAENGADGSTHGETIEDWRDFLSNLKIFDAEYDDFEDFEKYDLTLEQSKIIENDIDDCEKYHIENNTIDSEIG
jgi:hypothetical protein